MSDLWLAAKGGIRVVRKRDAGLPTIGDVAARAGVSAGTVSKALNGRGQLSPETRRRVSFAAQELGFHARVPDPGPARDRTDTVGVLVSDGADRVTNAVVLGAENLLSASQIAVILCDGRGDPIREQHYVRIMLARGVDGVIVIGRTTDPRPSLHADLPIPTIYARARSTHAGDLSLLHDERHGAQLAIDHLLASGRSRIVHVTGPERQLAVQEQAEGAVSALAAAGIGLVGDKPLMGEWSERWGREAITALLSRGAAFDGVVCGSDLIARGVADALREAGRLVPDDVGIVGFDNWEALATAARPPLTTIDPNLSDLGRTAATKLLRAIDGHRPEHGVQLLPCSLITRRSTEMSPEWAAMAPNVRVPR
jgi:LacI family transcriptional regulator